MQTFRRRARTIVIGAATLYTAVTVALALLWALSPQSAWWVTLTNIFAAPLFLPLALLIPLAVALRSRGLRAAVALPALLFLTLFGARFVPVARAPDTGTQLRVATFNHWYSNPNVDAIIAAVRAQHADVVALQELSVPVERAIRQQLKDEYPYQMLAPAEFDYGVGIISRYPLRELPNTYSFSGQMAAVQVGGRELTIINIHLPAPSVKMKRLGREQPWQRLWRVTDYNAKLRTDEYPALLDVIDATRGPLIVLGDHNTGDREPPYTQLAARLHDAWRETNWGFGFTFPNNKRMFGLPLPFPLVRIDYIWSKNGVLPMAAHVDCNRSGADHCMLVADLRLTGDAAE